LVLLLWGELEALGFQSLQFVVDPDVGSHQEGLCVKIVKGVLSVVPKYTTESEYKRVGLGI